MYMVLLYIDFEPLESQGFILFSWINAGLRLGTFFFLIEEI